MLKENTHDIIQPDLLTVAGLFGSAINKHLNTIAVIFKNEQITYSELNDRADKLSVAINELAPGEKVIGVSTCRNIEMVIAVLAILKAGKAYLPLDPRYPVQRLQQLVSDSRILFCVCTENELQHFDTLGLHAINSSEDYHGNSTLPFKQNDVACVLYTSGSTGIPKGVCLTQKGLVNFINYQLKHADNGIGKRSLQFCHLSFDASFYEIFVPLISGGTIYLIDDAIRLDGGELLSFIETNRIEKTFLPYVALQYLAEAIEAENVIPKHLKQVVTGGALLKITPVIRNMFDKLHGSELVNVYGPTETSIWVTELKLHSPADQWPQIPAIGTCIASSNIYFIDEKLLPVKDAEAGEIFISGDCVANGYLNQPGLTADRFISLENKNGEKIRGYKTGDFARRTSNGNIEFIGRKDEQVKIRGNRVEPAEIETALTLVPGINEAVVIANEDEDGEKYMVAYLRSNDEVDTIKIRQALTLVLPSFMIPSFFIQLKNFPLTTSGKIDKKGLPLPQLSATDVTSRSTPNNDIKNNISSAWKKILKIEIINESDNFFEIGGNSLLAQKLVAILKNKFGYRLPVTKIYQYPTLESQVNYLVKGENLSGDPLVSHNADNHSDIAIISMSGRFPGANDIETFWENIKAGKETISFFEKEEIDPFVTDKLKSDPAYVAARGILDNADAFDAAFFGIPQNLAALMDPQQRIFLEISREALEKAGYVEQVKRERIGVFAGCGTNTYYLKSVLANADKLEAAGHFQVMTLNEKDYISTRTAYQLNLKGPAVSVQSACSTSLLAVAQAVESLRKGQCEMALAGGASVTYPVKSGHLYEEGAMLSKDGHCRSFDASATGTVFSDGAGVVLLKPLKKAIIDGDKIYAVIKGVGVNNDGGGKGSFTAPSAEGQAGAISMAIRDAGIDPATISYVEAHGTATPIGDPIEIDGLKMAFGKLDKTQFCAVGSVKSNVGHLTAAAGIAGLIKTALCLHHKLLTPSIRFENPNPEIDFYNSPFYVNASLKNWTNDIRRAGVSSFGVGGTNVHTVLEAYDEPVFDNTDTGRKWQLFCWSAKSAESAVQYPISLNRFLHQNKKINLADAAFTLHTSRPAFNYRGFVVVDSVNNMVDDLGNETKIREQLLQAGTTGKNNRNIVFLFPGQGAQFPNMGRTLYDEEPVFKAAIDTCAELALKHIDADIRTIIYSDEQDAFKKLHNTLYTQAALFSTSYATAKLWASWGLDPYAFCGHSVGEYVAATLAGIFSLEDAVMLVCTRAKMASSLPGGTTLSIRIPYEKLQNILPGNISVAAINSPELCVVAGAFEAIALFIPVLKERRIPFAALEISHAFHSAMMDEIVAPFQRSVQSVKLHAPNKKIISTVTGNWLTNEEATDPAYWAKHIRSTVQFSGAITTAMEVENAVFVEAGPGSITATLARRQATPKSIPVYTSMENRNDQHVCEGLLKTLGQLWQLGVPIDWQKFYQLQQRRKISLPTYVFDKKYCWVDAPKTTPAEAKETISPPTPKMPDTVPAIQPLLLRKDVLIEAIFKSVTTTTGIETTGIHPSISFLEMGLDSLVLTQLAIQFKKLFGLPLTFRQLNEDCASPGLLADYLDEKLEQGLFMPVTPELAATVYSQQNTEAPSLDFLAKQLQVLSLQVTQLITNRNRPSTPVALNTITTQPAKPALEISASEAAELKKPFGAAARIEKKVKGITEQQQQFLQTLIARYNKKTIGSKNYTQQHRAYMADPRVVSGFKPLTKELVYPIVINKSKGSTLWDIDGNTYIDLLNGFGSTLFGYQPEFITKAIHEQIEKGYEIGPQHELAGEVSKLIADMTGHERVGLCNTGSEAILGAMRVARTVTGRSLIAAFSGSYHGINDEVIIRGTKSLKSFPASPGIMPEAVQNMLILDYGTEESLQILRERISELAAILVEPVQSRRPEFRPVEFLKELRHLTAANDTALIFDEVITGFRMHPGGVQAMFGIKADLATYGKVVGGGLSIGVIAGSKQYMDALDGGYWQYGDDSIPEAGVTYFAGTFVRHPLALAASKASLLYMKEKGGILQKNLNTKTSDLADRINLFCKQKKLPIYVASFGSLWKIKYKEEIPYIELLFALMREKGIHIWDGFPCFITEGHSDEDLYTVLACFKDSVQQMTDHGFFRNHTSSHSFAASSINPFEQSKAPAPGAKLGRDKAGNPAWFLPDLERPGKYLQIDLTT